MKRNLKRDVTDFDGNPIKIGDDVLTVDKAVKQALLSHGPGDDSEPPDRKFGRWKLAERIHSSPSDVELSAEEIADIKKRIAGLWPAAVVGPVFMALEE